MGPNIIATQPAEHRRGTMRSKYEGQSGVRQANGAWIAIKDGRFAGEFRGKRGFLAATRAAGTTRRLA